MEKITWSLKTLEKRELHLPDSALESIAGSDEISAELESFDAEDIEQELDELASPSDHQAVLSVANSSGTVGIYVHQSHLLGRKSTGGIVSLTADEINTILGTRQAAQASSILDLSGGAISSLVIFHTTVACTLLKVILLYTEASSADAGVGLTIGKQTDADYYYTGDSEASKAEWYEKEVTLLQTAIAAGDTVICGTAGGKVGTGNVLICIEYKVD